MIIVWCHVLIDHSQIMLFVTQGFKCGALTLKCDEVFVFKSMLYKSMFYKSSPVQSSPVQSIFYKSMFFKSSPVYVLQIQSMFYKSIFYKSNPVHVLQYAYETNSLSMLKKSDPSKSRFLELIIRSTASGDENAKLFKRIQDNIRNVNRLRFIQIPPKRLKKARGTSYWVGMLVVWGGFC